MLYGAVSEQDARRQLKQSRRNKSRFLREAGVLHAPTAPTIQNFN